MMTESEWLASTDPARMLDRLRGQDADGLPVPYAGGMLPPNWTPGKFLVSDRKLRLFACACCRQVWDGTPCRTCGGEGRYEADNAGGPRPDGSYPKMTCRVCHGTGKVGGLTDPRSRRAVEVAERRADGDASDGAMDDAISEAIAVAAEFRALAHWVAPLSRLSGEQGHWPDGLLERLSPLIPTATQAALLREICGNPFRPVKLPEIGKKCPNASKFFSNHEWSEDGKRCIYCGQGRYQWLTPTVLAIAAKCYGGELCQGCFGNAEGPSYYCFRCAGSGRTPFDAGVLPVLADCLEDGGCTDADILQHLRGKESCPTCTYGRRQYYTRDGDYIVASCNDCSGTGWRPRPVACVRGCWVVDLILGKG